ncbi:MAG: ATPase, T2SS/T4P/T4SS family [Thermotaleaceae bacterium]
MSSLVDIAKWQGENISKTTEESKDTVQMEDKRYDELLSYARDKVNEEHPDLFLTSVFHKEVQEEARGWIAQYCREWIKRKGIINKNISVEDTITRIANSILSLDVLEPLLQIKGVTDIFVDSPDKIYYEANGETYYPDVRFRSEEDMIRVMKKLASTAGKSLNAENPVVNAQIGKNRFNISLGRNRKGLARKPNISIRVHRIEQFEPQELIEAEQVNQEIVDFLKDCAKCKKIGGMFFGPTGSGKSTSLDALVVASVPDDERTIIIEDEAEIRGAEKYPKKNIIEYVTKKTKSKDTTYTMARLVEDVALRAKPDRLVIGEIRKGEDGDKFLYAMATGHMGWSSGHSISAKEGVARLAKMVEQIRPNATKQEIIEDIFSVLDIIVYNDFYKINGKKVRKLAEIMELYQDDEGKNHYRMLFKHDFKKGFIKVNPISEKLAYKLETCGIDSTRWLKEGE